MEGVFSPSQFFLIHWHLSIKFELYNTLYFRTDGVFLNLLIEKVLIASLTFLKLFSFFPPLFMYEMNEHGMFLRAARSGQSLLNQLLTGRVRTMIESSSLSLFQAFSGHQSSTRPVLVSMGKSEGHARQKCLNFQRTRN